MLELNKLWPQSLKNRLILAFILLIIIPFTGLSLYNYSKVEQEMKLQANDQNMKQMLGYSSVLESLVGVAEKTFTLFEQDSFLINILQQPAEPGSYEALLQKNKMEERFNAINNSVFLTNSYVYYTLLDRHGRVFTSYSPSIPLQYDRLYAEPSMKTAFDQGKTTNWYLEPNFLYAGSRNDSRLVSMTRVLRDSRLGVYAVMKISMNYENWFRNMNTGSSRDESYHLITREGTVVATTGEGRSDAELTMGIPGWEGSGSIQSKDSIVTYILLPSLGWYMTKHMPTDLLFKRVNDIQRSVLVTSLLLMLLFIGITLIIATTVTRPLLYLQRKMSDVVRNNLQVQLEETRYKGEIQTFVHGFNKMVRDMDVLVQRLKLEERQKEAMRFQMLLSQMNPHFLLNTLNTVKWLALEQGNRHIPEACESLGRLLEAGMKLDVDLIHFEQERQLLEDYIVIQQLRYDRPFELRFELEDELRYALIPKLSLQPLIENSIYHGFAGSDRTGVIVVRLKRMSQSQLYVEVEDNGAGLAPAAVPGVPGVPGKGHGIALSNLEERLRLLFRDDCELKLVPLSQGVLVRIRIPLLLSTPYQP